MPIIKSLSYFNQNTLIENGTKVLLFKIGNNSLKSLMDSIYIVEPFPQLFLFLPNNSQVHKL